MRSPAGAFEPRVRWETSCEWNTVSTASWFQSGLLRAIMHNLSSTEICRQLAEHKAETYMLLSKHS